jgi:hypothetical protein
MGSPRSNSILYNVVFTRTVVEIRAACERKAADLGSLVEERQRRINRYCEEYRISQDDLIGLFAQADRDASKMSYSLSTSRATYNPESGGEDDDESPAFIPAGVVAAIRSERANLENDRAAAHRLALYARAVRPIQEVNSGVVVDVDWFTVTAEDIEFLGL